MGTDTVFWGPEQIGGQARCPVHRSGTFKAQRSTLSFQRADRKGAWWAEYGDRHRISFGSRYGDRHGILGARANRGTGTMSDRPGTFNVQRSTLSFQRGGRKGAWRAGYGDRHGVLPAGSANKGTGTIFGPGVRIFDTSELTQRPVGRSNRAAAPRYGDRHNVRYTGQERST